MRWSSRIASSSPVARQTAMNRLPKMPRLLQRRPPALVVEQRDVLDQAGELVARQQARFGEGQPAGPEDEAVDEDQARTISVGPSTILGSAVST